MFLIQEFLFIANVKPFTPKSVMNKPQAEGRVNHTCTEERRRRRFNTSAKKKTILVYPKSFLLITMVELDHQRSEAKTLVDKMGLDTFVSFNRFHYCRFVCHILRLHFTHFN